MSMYVQYSSATGIGPFRILKMINLNIHNPYRSVPTCPRMSNTLPQSEKNRQRERERSIVSYGGIDPINFLLTCAIYGHFLPAVSSGFFTVIAQGSEVEKGKETESPKSSSIYVVVVIQ